jgi:hypothetical protein
LPAERRRFLAGVGRRLTAQALSRRDAVRRYPILLTLVAQSAVDVLDEALLLFDQALSGRESVVKAKLTEALAERARGGEDRQALLDEILQIVLDSQVANERMAALLRDGVGLGRLRAVWAARQQRLPRDHGHLAMLDASMGYVRQFAPDVLRAVRFASGTGTEELLQAVATLTELYATGARRVPPDAPAGFVPARWAGYWTRRPRCRRRGPGPPVAQPPRERPLLRHPHRRRGRRTGQARRRRLPAAARPDDPLRVRRRCRRLAYVTSGR